MSVAAPTRPPHVAAGTGAPIRRPDVSSPEVMTRRAWWLVILNVLVPGSAQVLAGSRRLGRFGLGATLLLWTLLIVHAVWALTSWTSLLGFYAGAWVPDAVGLLRAVPLLVLQALLFGYALLWAVLTIDTLRLTRLVHVRAAARLPVALLAVVLLVVTSGVAVWAGQRVGSLRDTLATLFATSAPSVPPSDGHYNILLLGADSGDGRDSMRFDSISVVSVNAETGALTIVGIPRDLYGPPFSEGPMNDLYPDGFEGYESETCGWTAGINQLMNAVEVCREDGGTGLFPDAAARGSSPAIEATKQAAEGVLGIEIPYYVFIDMHGFADLIDALGGVEITVQERLPKGGGPAYDGQSADEWAIGWIEEGTQHMDGDTAQWYARSRYTTSDWDRMRRQRELQQAILAQMNPMNVMLRFQEVMSAGRDLVSTDLPASMLPYFAELALDAKGQPVTTLELTPEGIGIDPDDPDPGDWDVVRETLHDILHPPAPEE
ncbi:LCP family protein [Microbacterium sp. No. 7]|uniref:LCP family protein n=1 Tax=Microbacterium sp. No. 7 TaxID=1714373 RepID=UPI0006CF2231|nr:LCP family protein [Microbacterium sp. No. 7]ALJ19372.1 transcriptional regulator [Microbacterium sp. No. 7]